ncbi:MAG: EamA family transporter [Fibrobacterota bacterium]
MLLSGILYGFGAAFSQSSSYFFSKSFLEKFRGNSLLLLIYGHLAMGLIAVIIFPFLIPFDFPEISEFLPEMLLATLFYLGGQITLFSSLRYSDASRVSPLLGMKIFVLALIKLLFFDSQINGLQWGAVALSVSAAFLLSLTGGRMDRRSVYWIAGACVSYSLSDINIRIFVDNFSEAGIFKSSLIGVCLIYTLCGAVSLIALSFLKTRPSGAFRKAFPFGAAWLTGMIFLFACFASIGVVFGNIIQSTRGVISILAGATLSKLGYESIEKKTPAGIVFKRSMAALLMWAAIILYYIGV